MPAQTILLEGKPYVVLPRDEYDRLDRIGQVGGTAAVAPTGRPGQLPGRGVRPAPAWHGRSSATVWQWD